MADLLDTDRTHLLVEAIREYVDERADSEAFKQLVATKCYDDRLDFETVKQVLDAETAQRFRLLEADLERDPYDLEAPDDVDVYDGAAEAVYADGGDENAAGR